KLTARFGGNGSTGSWGGASAGGEVAGMKGSGSPGGVPSDNGHDDLYPGKGGWPRPGGHGDNDGGPPAGPEGAGRESQASPARPPQNAGAFQPLTALRCGQCCPRSWRLPYRESL